MLTQLIADGVISGFFIALLAVGFTLLYSASRFFVFTYGVSFVWAAYASLVFGSRFGHIASGVVGVIAGVMIGALLELLIFRSMRLRGKSAMVLMLASIGAYVVLQNIVSIGFGDGTRSVRTWATRQGHVLFGAYVTDTQLVIVLGAIIAMGLVWTLLRFATFGKELRAVANDSRLARVVGINVDAVVLFAGMIGGGIAGLAGVLSSLDTDLVPNMGFQGLLLGVVGCVLGGVGDLKGAVVGGFCLGLVQSLSVWRFSTQWQDAIVFGVLIIFLLVRPRGFRGNSVGRVGAW